jgi:2-oxoglutarate ferredoxin oxidoreductase subunit alpha
LRLIEQSNVVRYETTDLDDAEIVVVAFGTAARVAQTAVKRLRAGGMPVGLFRPITLWPFPHQELARLAKRTPSVRTFLVVEMNAGQMLHDVREAVGGHIPVRFKGRMGGVIPLPEEIEEELRLIMTTTNAHAFRMEANNGRAAR